MSDETLRDRIASLSRRELAGLAAIVAVTLAGAGLWYVRSLPKPVRVVSRTGGAAFAAPAAAPSATTSPATLFVDVAGAVRRPGVYEFRSGQRVIDAIGAAGGERRDAALEGLNLAAPLADGTQVLVPERSPDAQPNGQPGVGTSADGASGAVGSGMVATINVNTADVTELQELPGIGEVLSQAIVDYRTQNGPFGSVDELEDVSGIGPATLADIRDLVSV
jgi:competence protein ComEA